MKATIGALLIGLAGASAALAQPPVYAPMPSAGPGPGPAMPMPPMGARLSTPNSYQGPPNLTPPFVPVNQPGVVSGQAPIPTPMPIVPTPVAPLVPGADGAAPGYPDSPPFMGNSPYMNNVPTGLAAPFGDGGAHVWLSADYLFMWTKRGPLPEPLVVTGSPNDAFPGALDQPGTQVLYGGKDFNYNITSGVRVGLGFWAGADQRYGLEANGIYLSPR